VIFKKIIPKKKKQQYITTLTRARFISISVVQCARIFLSKNKSILKIETIIFLKNKKVVDLGWRGIVVLINCFLAFSRAGKKNVNGGQTFSHENHDKKVCPPLKSLVTAVYLDAVIELLRYLFLIRVEIFLQLGREVRWGLYGILSGNDPCLYYGILPCLYYGIFFFEKRLFINYFWIFYIRWLFY